MLKYFYSFALGLLILSCRKESTLRKVRFNGSVLNAVDRTGIPNVTVKMYWSNINTSLETPIDSTITDTQGNYVFDEMIDLSRFSEHTLEIFAVIPGGFVSTLDLNHSEIGMSYLGIQSDNVQTIPLHLYRKAPLRIRLNRTMNDSFTQFEAYYDYGGRGYWVVITNAGISGTQAYDVVTAGHIQTRVYWKKTFNTGTTTQAVDSIICLPTAANEVIMNY